jgi:hypothetical protein
MYGVILKLVLQSEICKPYFQAKPEGVKIPGCVFKKKLLFLPWINYSHDTCHPLLHINT